LLGLMTLNNIDMKFRKHHNNKGYHQIKEDKMYKQVERIRRKLKIGKGEN
jgi:hypothetical protein